MSEQLDPQGVDVREILDANRLTISNLANDFYQAGGVPNKEIGVSCRLLLSRGLALLMVSQ